MQAGCTENFRRFAPFALQAIKCRRDDEDHQRYLEEQIGDGEAPERQDVEAQKPEINADLRLQKNGKQADRTERGDEGKGERHAGKLRSDAGKGEKRAADALRQATQHHGCGHGKADQAAERCRGKADLDRNPVSGKDR
ncbi:hypothetical protein D3C86_1560980 [compost metagenome]